ncbi:unnamed protein product [Linum tenue]|uniref:Secreted protein n=1 Tax=Linum tenue TaxID=586396 RepID=A0AAV0R539_9ROSI|nr:unnamed protein product [Linum tenue]
MMMMITPKVCSLLVGLLVLAVGVQSACSCRRLLLHQTLPDLVAGGKNYDRRSPATSPYVNIRPSFSPPARHG